MSRKPSSLAMAAMLVVVVCVPGGATAVVHDTDATMLDPSRSDIVWATKFRTTFALDASPTTVERAADDGQAYPDMTWGVPLSRAEADTLHQRLWLVLSTLPAVELARKDPAWAGWWLDHESGGTPVLLFAADPAEKRAGLADRLPAGVEVRVERVERPLTDLEAMRHKLFASEADLTKAGTVLTAVGLDIVGNRLTIGVEASSRSTRDAIADLIGDAFVLREEGAAGADSCPRTECLPPLKAGVGLQDQSGAWSRPETAVKVKTA